MLFMGQELLEDEQFADNNPLDWTHATTCANVVNFYRDLIHLRRNLDGVSLGLTGPNVSSHVVRNDAPWKLLAFHRWGAGADDQVMAVMNFTANLIPSYVVSGWPGDGNWFVNLNSDWITYGADFGNPGSAVVNVSGGSGQVAVGPYSVWVLSCQALPGLNSDGDGLLNGWEQQYFGNPLSGIATADDDLDGAINLQEQAAGTNPNLARSALRFTHISATNGAVTLRWTGGESARQVVQQANAATGTWTAILTNGPPTSITNSLTIPLSPAAASFFRIGIVP